MLRMITAGALAASLAAPAFSQQAAPVEGDKTQTARPGAFAYPITRKDTGATTYMMRFKSNAARRNDARDRAAAKDVLAESGANPSDSVAFRSRQYAEPTTDRAAFR